MAENKNAGAKETKMKKFIKDLNGYEQAVIKLMGEKYGISPQEFMMSIVHTVKTTPKILDCDPKTIFASILLAAELGLRVSTQGNPEGLCYLVPYKGKCQLQIGYKGYIEIAYRSTRVKSIIAIPVYENEFYSENEKEFKHVKWNGLPLNELQLIKANKDFLKENGFSDTEINEYIEDYKKRIKIGKGVLKLVYAACQLEGIEKPLFTSITSDVLKQIEAMSPSSTSDYSPYKNNTDVHNSMQTKAAIKKLFKYLPKLQLNEKLSRAIEVDDAFMSGKTAVLGEGNEVKLIDDKAEKTSKFESHFAGFEDVEFSEEKEQTTEENKESQPEQKVITEEKAQPPVEQKTAKAEDKKTDVKKDKAGQGKINL